MRAWRYGRRGKQGSECHMYILAFAHNGVQQRTALPAKSVMVRFATKPFNILLAGRQRQTVHGNPGKGFERRARRALTIRTMADEGILEWVGNLVCNSTAVAGASQGCVRVSHGTKPG